jgi:hypothetical protein
MADDYLLIYRALAIHRALPDVRTEPSRGRRNREAPILHAVA